MISTRAKGTSLLNHLRQRGIPFEVSPHFVDGLWRGTIQVYGETFPGQGRTQKQFTSDAMTRAEPIIYKNIRPKGYSYV
jgi:hypothetical protein|tara:strand:+ start:352 stop:588 length:237 start_codon:yes stop_codon:yes gene_type:complete